MYANTSSSILKRWYVVQTQAGREQLASAHLARQNFDCFCPIRYKLRRSGRKHVKVAFFTGYLFVSLNLESEAWRSINGTVGVTRLVAFGNGGRPTSLPRGFVERLRESSPVNCEIADELQAGDQVRVIGGPLDDLCGVLNRASESGRVTILLALLGQETRVSLPHRSLMAA
jgi:transcriptional antiterminator RfaH